MEETASMTTPARQTAAALLNLVRTLAPSMDQAVLRAALHAAANAAKAAAADGISTVELLFAILEMTAPPPLPGVPVQPWVEYLPMPLDEFSAAGVTLELFLRPMQLTLWLGELAAPAWATGTGQIWDTRRMKAELAAAKVAEAEWTVGRLIAVLAADVRCVRRGVVPETVRR